METAQVIKSAMTHNKSDSINAKLSFNLIDYS